MGMMNLEQAIKRTEAVIGLPFALQGRGFAYNERAKTVAVLHESVFDSTMNMAYETAFALLRDHAQAACDERGWTVRKSVVTYKSIAISNEWYVVESLTHSSGIYLAVSAGRLDAMLSALESAKEGA